ncbi:Hypothetical protein DEACI_1334 [Acididesulfobacillus acetoxydans]|uniref:Uncharacterized protein n=1 Tax=Acididesulfobacillus acetoxydans TaxID=1561005 RepID=A0A8S0WX24_9FIRM|nr:hypothetical protein [Acididesulfobacillus acetoxydans]CAA7600681.1 Hypothetical protein DEACI_1334 [Acididesulfobacillus acetoxydans]CEJ09462.1 Hypothetical protein DEACI_3946 [Acididesulfobacillus acetoxydans]
MSERRDQRDQEVFHQILTLNSDIEQYLALAPSLKLPTNRTEETTSLPVPVDHRLPMVV